MTIFYVDSTATGDDGGSDWTNAFLSLEAALADAGTVAGSDVYMDDGSAYAYSAHAVLASKGTLAAPINIYSVDKADDSYSVGAIVDASGGAYSIKVQGIANTHGVHFKSGASILADANNIAWTFVGGILEITSTSSAELLFNNARTGPVFKLIDTDIKFGHAGQGIHCDNGSVFEWFGGTLLTLDIDVLVNSNSINGGIARIRGVDLSIISGGALFNGFGASSNEPGFAGEIAGCKLNATPPVLVLDTVPAVDGAYLTMINCGSEGIPQTQIHTSQGDIVQETTVKRTATYDGTNGYSYNMTTNSNADLETPLRFKVAEIWCAADSTLTVEFTHDAAGSGAGGNFNDDELWLEVEYPTVSNAAYRQWNRTSKAAIFAAGSLLTAGSSGDWTAGKTDFDKIVVTISSGAAGVHTIWACLAPASKTVYVCPKVDVS